MIVEKPNREPIIDVQLAIRSGEANLTVHVYEIEALVGINVLDGFA